MALEEKLFGPDEEFEVRDLFGKYWPALINMKDAASGFLTRPDEQTRQLFLKSHEDFCQATESVNKRFITLCLNAYMRLLELSGLRSGQK